MWPSMTFKAKLHLITNLFMMFRLDQIFKKKFIQEKFFLTNFRLHYVSIYINFYQNQFIN